VLSDTEGRFQFATAHRHVELWAFSARGGLAKLNLSEIQAGEEKNDLRLKLAGAHRIRGRVSGPNGEPVPDVWCNAIGWTETAVRSDPNGRFDLGWFPMNPKDRQWVDFKAPRPMSGPFVKQPIEPDGSSVFYLHQRVPIVSAKSEEIRLDVRLQPADVLTFRGRVVNTQGKPVADATVSLIAGNADPEALHNVGKRMMRNAFEDIGRRWDIRLAGTQTDASGRYQLQTVRETEASFRIPHGGDADASRFSITAVSKDKDAVKLIPDIIVPENRTEMEIKVPLDEKPGDAENIHFP
jgi:hypothetical protein